MPHTTDTPLLYAITGTDTGVGKTVVACAIAARARERGLRVAVMKPLETGVAPGVDNRDNTPSDAERLRRAAGSVDALSLVCPFALAEPLAPLVAAQRAGVTLNIDRLDASYASLSTSRDVVLAEGAGGLLTPISAGFAFLDLFARWRCALIVVAANRLGVLNHVLLTVHAAKTAGVPVRAIVLCETTNHNTGLAASTNFDALVALLPGETVLRFPYVEDADNLDALALAASQRGFDILFTPQATPPNGDSPVSTSD